MSAPNPSDPRLLLPDWLRDGDALVAAPAQPKPAEHVVAVVEATEAGVVPPGASEASATPFSERLALDTLLDPQQLVSAADLPSWLGGLERAPVAVAATIAHRAVAPSSTAASVAPPPVAPIEEPGPYEGVDAPEDGVIDVEVNGWYMVAGALGLLILLAAALRLYLA